MTVNTTNQFVRQTDTINPVLMPAGGDENTKHLGLDSRVSGRDLNVDLLNTMQKCCSVGSIVRLSLRNKN